MPTTPRQNYYPHHGDDYICADCGKDIASHEAKVTEARHPIEQASYVVCPPCWAARVQAGNQAAPPKHGLNQPQPAAPATMQWKEIPRDKVGFILDCTPGQNVLLLGPPGVGKSGESWRYGERANLKVYTTTGGSEDSKGEAIGHFMPKGGEFVPHVGPMLRARSEGGLLVINEIGNYGNAGVDILHMVLDDEGGGDYDAPWGITYSKHKDFRAIASTNESLDSLRPAILDRFAIRIFVKEPSTEMLNILPEDVREVCRADYATVTPTNPNPRFTFREYRNFAKLRDDLNGRGDIAALLVASTLEKAQGLVEACAQVKPIVTRKGGKA